MKIGNSTVTVDHDLEILLTFARRIKMDLNGVIHPHIFGVKGAFFPAHFIGERFTAVKEEIEIFFISKHLDSGMDFHKIFLESDKRDVRGLFPGGIVSFSVNKDLFAFFQESHITFPVFHGGSFAEIACCGILSGFPESGAEEFDTLNSSFVFTGKPDCFVKESVDPFDFLSGKDFCPQAVF